MTLKIAVCDDLNTERIQLSNMIRSYCSKQQIDAEIVLFSDGDELLTAFHPGMFHILFLDIYMPGLDGMATARQIRKQDTQCSILFATTSEDHGMESYEVQASDYLVKPFREEDVASAMDWCVSQIQERYGCLTVISEGNAVEVSLADLRYIEIQSHQASLYTKDGVITTRRGLDELEKDISHPDFLRCHRSFLVNMNYIKWIEKNDFCLHDGDLVPIGSTTAAAVKEKFLDWSFIKAWERRF